LILFENPFYPLGGGKYIDAHIDRVRYEELRSNQLHFLFGKTDASILDWIEFLLWRGAHFPSASLLTLLGFVFVAHYRKLPDTLPLLLWGAIYYFYPVIPLAHERYILMYLPALTLLSALPLTFILDICSASLKRSSIKKRMVSLCVVLWLVCVLLSVALPISVVGTSFSPYHPPSDPLLAFKTLGADKFTFLRLFYGEHMRIYEWLEDRVNISAKVALLGHDPPLLKQSDLRVLFYLDSPEASPLRKLTEPSKIVQFFNERNIKYIHAPEWVRASPYYADMPFLELLGSPSFFPIIFDLGVEKIYNVGPIDDVITKGSGVPVHINFFDNKAWSDVYFVNGTAVRDVIGGSFTPRLWVTSESPLTVIRIKYLDKEGSLAFNLHHKNGVYLDYAKIVSEGTEQWRIFEFLVPTEGAFTEFGLFASNNFTIAKIEAEPFQVSGKYSVFNLGKEITNRTIPPTLMVYLPPLKGGEKIVVETKSYGRSISVEIFEGVIQPWETTKWWERHRMVARVLELPTWGVQNPTLIWKAELGVYTLVVVLWDEYIPDARVDLSITIGGSR